MHRLRSGERAPASGFYVAVNHYHEDERQEAYAIMGETLPSCRSCGLAICWEYGFPPKSILIPYDTLANTYTGTREEEQSLVDRCEERHFPNTVRDSIVSGIKNVLGEEGMRVVLFHLQLVQYAKDPKEFHDNLYSVFGPGAIILEKMIVKELFERMGIPYEVSEPFDFKRYVDLARRIVSKSLK